MTRRSGRLGMAVRSAVTHPALTGFAVVIVALIAFAGAAAPGLVQRVQTDSMRYALDATPVIERDLTATTRGAPRPGVSREDFGLSPALAQVWGHPLQQLADERAAMDPVLPRVLSPARVVVEFDASEALQDRLDPKPRSEILLRYDPELASLVTWVRGNEPAPAGPDGVAEFGLTAEAAEAMGWQLDEIRELPRVGGVTQQVRLTGIYEVDDPSDADWAYAPLALHYSRVVRGLESPLYTAVGFGAPSDLDSVLGLEDNVRTIVWYSLDVDSIRADETHDLIAAMRLFFATTVDLDINAVSFFIDGLQFDSTATRTMTDAQHRIDALSALAALIASGPLAVAVVVLALTSRILAVRRRNTQLLAAARGASPRLRAGLLAAEGAAIGAIGGIGGGVAGAYATQGRGWIVALVPVLVALTPAIALPVLGLLVSRRRVRADLGMATAVSARWRLVAEVSVVAVTALVVALVLTHALARDQSAPDPLLTALPLLLAAVGCVITLRLVPLGLAFVERTLSKRRGLIALVGPARARRDPVGAVASVLAIVVGVAIGVFAAVFSTTVDAGIGVAARAEVGADLRVQSGYLSPDQLDALSDLDGVAAIAPVYAHEQRDGELPTRSLRVTVYVVDVGQVRAVQNDPDSAIAFPDALLEPAGEAVPVLASDELAARADGETLLIDGIPVRIVGVAPARSPLGGTHNWIAVDRSLADDLKVTQVSPAVALLALDPGVGVAGMAEAAHDIAGTDAIVSTPASVAATRLDDPALLGLRGSLVLAVGVVALLLALSIGIVLVLGAPARGRLLALLAALGFRRSRELALIVWEVAPAVVVALPIGALVGLVLPLIVIPSLDLTGFVGGSDQPAVRLGGPLPVWVLLGVVAVTVVAVLLAALVARRVTTAATLRNIDEES